MSRFVFIGGVGILLSGCATAPLAPLPASNPASPEAREAVVPVHHNSLAADAATRKSREFLEAGGQGASGASGEMSGMEMGGPNGH